MDVAMLRQRAESGSVAAQSILGDLLSIRVDTEIDYQKAFRLLRAASNRGVRRAVVNLGRMCAEAYGVQRHAADVIRLYRAVSEIEFFGSLELGRIYSNGIGIPPDSEAALKWYSVAVTWKDRVSDPGISEQVAWARGVPRAEDIRRAELFVSKALHRDLH